MRNRIFITNILFFLFRFSFGQIEESSPETDSDISTRENQSDTIVLPEYSEEHIRLDQVTIRSPLLPNKLQSIPSNIAYLSHDKITFSDRNSFMEPLNQVPGVYVHSGSFNTNRITIRGIGSRTPYATNRIKAYYNDIPLTTGDGTTVIEDIDPSMINTIQILKGAKSAMYGPGLGGFILISGKEYFRTGLHGNVGMETGMYGSYKPEFNLQYKKENLSLSAAYSLTRSNGWRQNSQYKRHSANINAGIKGKKSSTKILMQFIDLNASIPSSLNYSTFQNSPDSAASGWLAVKGYEQYRKLLSGINYTTDLTSSIQSVTVGFINIFNGYESRPFNILDDDAVQMGYNSHMRFTWGNARLRLGYQFIFEKYNWSIYDTDSGNQGDLMNRFEVTRHPINIFAQGGYELKNGGNIEAGLSYNFLRYNLTDKGADTIDVSGSYRYKPVLSPFIGINLPLGEFIRVYGSLGHGYSPPSVEETLLPEGELNTMLKPESGVNLEFGSRLNALNGDLYIDATLYLLLVKDLLVTERISEDVFYGANAGSSRHEGLELSGGLRLNKNRMKSLPEIRLNLSFTVSDNRFTDFVDDGNIYSDNQLPGVPSSAIWGNFSLHFRKDIYFNYQYQYAGMQYIDDANLESYPGHQVSSVKLGIKLQDILGLNSEIYIGVKNLFNAHYASMILVNAPSFDNASPRYYYPGQPRYIYGGIRISF